MKDKEAAFAATWEGVPSLCRVLLSDQMQVQQSIRGFQNRFRAGLLSASH
jgi:hypothetical protein